MVGSSYTDSLLVVSVAAVVGVVVVAYAFAVAVAVASAFASASAVAVAFAVEKDIQVVDTLIVGCNCCCSPSWWETLLPQLPLSSHLVRQYFLVENHFHKIETSPIGPVVASLHQHYFLVGNHYHKIGTSPIDHAVLSLRRTRYCYNWHRRHHALRHYPSSLIRFEATHDGDYFQSIISLTIVMSGREENTIPCLLGWVGFIIHDS